MSDRKKAREAVTRAYTINLKKLCHKTSFKKKAPKAMKKIRKFAQQVMGTKDVRLDVKLNKSVWSRGIRSIPNRIRVHISRKWNDDEDAAEEFYSYVTVAEDQTTKGKSVEIIEQD